jgi:hypothetical protein
MISNFVNPSMIAPILHNFLNDLGDTVLGILLPICETVFPPTAVDSLSESFTSLAQGKIDVSQVVEQSMIPLATSSCSVLLTLFPEFGREVIDSVTDFFEHVTIWIRHADTNSFLEYGTSTVSQYMIPLMGLDDSYIKQASRIMSKSVSELLPEPNRVDLTELASLDHIPSWLPSWDEVQTSLLTLAKSLAALKAQQAVASALASSFSSYVKGGGGESLTKVPDDVNPLLVPQPS